MSKFEKYMDDYESYKKYKLIHPKCNFCSCQPHCNHSCDDCNDCPDCGCDKCIPN